MNRPIKGLCAGKKKKVTEGTTARLEACPRGGKPARGNASQKAIVGPPTGRWTLPQDQRHPPRRDLCYSLDGHKAPIAIVDMSKVEGAQLRNPVASGRAQIGQRAEGQGDPRPFEQLFTQSAAGFNGVD